MTCPNCHLSNQLCICQQLEQFELTPAILIFRHYKESYKASNTARIMALSSPDVKIIEYGKKDGDALPNLTNSNNIVVFPSSRSVNEYDHSFVPDQIIIIDGSWKQARRMHRRIPGLATLSHLKIAEANPPLPRIRKPNFTGGMSTMEACIQALSWFASPTCLNGLRNNYILWLNQVRKNTGIRGEILPGSSFKEARYEQDIEDGKIIPPR